MSVAYPGEEGEEAAVSSPVVVKGHQICQGGMQNFDNNRVFNNTKLPMHFI